MGNGMEMRKVVADILLDEFGVLESVKERVEDGAWGHVREGEHEVFGAIGGDGDAGVVGGGEELSLEVSAFLAMFAEELGLVGEFALVGEEGGEAGVVLSEDDGAVADLEAADVVASGDDEGNREVELAFGKAVLFSEVKLDLHEGAVDDARELEPGGRPVIGRVENGGQHGFEDGDLGLEGPDGRLGAVMGALGAAAAVADDERGSGGEDGEGGVLAGDGAADVPGTGDGGGEGTPAWTDGGGSVLAGGLGNRNGAGLAGTGGVGASAAFHDGESLGEWPGQDEGYAAGERRKTSHSHAVEAVDPGVGVGKDDAVFLGDRGCGDGVEGIGQPAEELPEVESLELDRAWIGGKDAAHGAMVASVADFDAEVGDAPVFS